MFTQNAFTLTIGNEGALLILHSQKTVKSKILIKTLSQNEKFQTLQIFKENSRAPIYILLDNAEQNYVKKVYPPVNILDLQQIIRRYFKQEFPVSKDNDHGDAVYNYLAEKNKKINKWECTFVSSTYFDEMRSWIDFLVQEVPNPIIGIYMLPIETISLVEKLRETKIIVTPETATTKNPEIVEKSALSKDLDNASNNSPAPSRDLTGSEKITLLITQNKVSGFRQIVFNDDKIVFTRLIHYDYDTENFIVNFEQDIFRTNEYLKRTFPNSKLEDMEIVNILPQNILDKVSTIKNREIHFTNYTPAQAAQKIGFEGAIAQNSQYSDILIASVFVNSKKILKSVNNQIRRLTLIRHTITGLSLINLAILFMILLYAFFIQTEQSSNKIIIDNLNSSKKTSEDALQKIKEETIGIQGKTASGQSVNVDEVIEFGKLDETMEANIVDPLELFRKMDFGMKKQMTIKSFSFNSVFIPEQNKTGYTLMINGYVNNESGDVENLFQIYDSIIFKAKEKFEGYKVSSSELPRDIDFSKKYYSVDFQLQITNQ